MDLIPDDVIALARQTVIQVVDDALARFAPGVRDEDFRTIAFGLRRLSYSPQQVYP